MAELDIDDVLSQLSMAEKCLLLAGSDFWHSTPVPRLGIPKLRMSDGPGTVRGSAFFNSTPALCTPCGPALAATWNKDLVQQVGELQGDECHAKGVHVLLGPCVNMHRTPVGARNYESFSEDPVLSGVMGGYTTRGLQAKGIIACPKHFLCSDQEQGCFSMNCLVTDRALREIYLMAFMLTIKLGNPGSIMTSYNRINGVHVSESHHLLTKVSREEWGFKGLVMCDWHGLYSIIPPIEAGLDLEMPGPTSYRGKLLSHAIIANQTTEKILDDRVRAVLKMVNEASRSGIPEDAPETPLDRPEDRALLRKTAAEGIVLLKNDEKVLPFKKDKPVLVIGPNARSSAYRGGRVAHHRPYEIISPYDAIKAKSTSGTTFSQGCFNHKERPLLGDQLKAKSGQQGFDMKIFVEPPEVNDRVPIVEYQFLNSCGFFFNYHGPELGTELWHAEITGTLIPLESGIFEFGMSVQGTANLYVDGKLVVDNTTTQKAGTGHFRAGTVEEVGFLEVKAGQKYEILVHWANPKTSKLVANSGLSFYPGGIRIGGLMPMDEDQAIANAAALASQYEQVVVMAGLMGDWETEGSDRAHMDLPPQVNALIDRVLAANKNAAICMNSGGAIAMPWADKATTLIHQFYGGSECGNAIADVLYGDVNPCGKLPVTFPVRLEDTPSFLFREAERKRILYGDDVFIGYRYFDTVQRPVLFPFGHGLSYTTFQLSNLTTSLNEGKELLTVSVSVTNTGDRPGAEVLQVYVAPLKPSVRRPTKELKEFRKVFLQPGQSQKVEISMELKYTVAFWDEAKNQFINEKGLYEIHLGTSSQGDILKAPFELSKSSWWITP